MIKQIVTFIYFYYLITDYQIVLLVSGLIDNCTIYESKPKPEFYPLRHCQRANGSIIGFRNVKTLDDCRVFAKEKGGLAFNYAPECRVKKNRYEYLNQTNDTTSMVLTKEVVKHKKIHTISEEYYNCQVLGCPEFGNFSTMVNDTRFDYYSLYTKPPRKFILD